MTLPLNARFPQGAGLFASYGKPREPKITGFRRTIRQFFGMASYLTKNGEAVCALVPSSIHPLPAKRQDCWHDCVVVTTERIVPLPTDVLGIQIPGCNTLPFRYSRVKIGVEGWEVEGQLLF